MTTLHAQLPYLDKSYNTNLATVAMLSVYRARILAERARRLQRGQELARIIKEQLGQEG